MTKKEALQILIESGCRDITGMGLGYRVTTDEWRKKVATAIRKLYKDAHNRDLTESAEYNIGISGIP